MPPKLPVAIVVYRRPKLTSEVLDAIKKYAPQKLYVISDGPKEQDPEGTMAVSVVRELFENLDWECQVEKIYSSHNLGLKQRVLSGLDMVFSQEDACIILEDDCVPNSDFFLLLESLASKFSQNRKIGLVSGANFAPSPNRAESYFFGQHALVWGWMTWARTWNEFRESSLGSCSGAVSKAVMRKLARGFITSPIQTFFLARTVRALQRLDSWATYFAVFISLRKLLVVQPKVNLVENKGFGEDASHTTKRVPDLFLQQQNLDFPLIHPGNVKFSIPMSYRENIFRLLKWTLFAMRNPRQFLAMFGSRNRK